MKNPSYTQIIHSEKRRKKKINVTTAKIHWICQEKTKSSQTQFLYSGIIHLKPPKNLTKTESQGGRSNVPIKPCKATHTQTLSILFKN